jgi:hypothetical protein
MYNVFSSDSFLDNYSSVLGNNGSTWTPILATPPKKIFSSNKSGFKVSDPFKGCHNFQEIDFELQVRSGHGRSGAKQALNTISSGFYSFAPGRNPYSQSNSLPLSSLNVGIIDKDQNDFLNELKFGSNANVDMLRNLDKHMKSNSSNIKDKSNKLISKFSRELSMVSEEAAIDPDGRGPVQSANRRSGYSQSANRGSGYKYGQSDDNKTVHSCRQDDILASSVDWKKVRDSMFGTNSDTPVTMPTTSVAMATAVTTTTTTTTSALSPGPAMMKTKPVTGVAIADGVERVFPFIHLFG